MPPEDGFERDRWLEQVQAAYRTYLHQIAAREIDHDLRAKISASDLVQDTFVEVQRDVSRFRGKTPAELKAWLRGILLHNLHNLRRRYRETARRQVAREQSFNDPAQAPPEPAADETSPSMRAAREELNDALRQAISRLPTHYRRVIELRVREKRSYEEIGRAVGLTPEATRKVYARALATLHSDLRPLLEA
jgi:RNA polymerase sigma-70 factor (ECF subfamily)